METKHLVFVYGTLRRNEHNHYLLKEATCIAEQAWTNGVMYATSYYYPVLTNQQKGTVYGELYEVNERQLSRLDELEGYTEKGNNNLYNRVKQTIDTDKGEYDAYVYVMNRRDPHFFQKPIESGNWKVYQLLKKPDFLYFAYGSCMDNKRFKEAKVNHYFEKVVGRGVVDGYSLRFTRRAHDGGRADIIEEGGVVEGKVYELTQEALPYLYRREGVKAGCYRPTVVQVRLDDDSIREALTFVVVEKEDEVAPPEHYMKEIVLGAEGWLSEKYMDTLLEKIKTLNQLT